MSLPKRQRSKSTITVRLEFGPNDFELMEIDAATWRDVNGIAEREGVTVSEIVSRCMESLKAAVSDRVTASELAQVDSALAHLNRQEAAGKITVPKQDWIELFAGVEIALDVLTDYQFDQYLQRMHEWRAGRGKELA